MRKIETLPEDQIYQVLDYIEFLESRYGSSDAGGEASGLQRLAEGIEDRLRNRSFNPSNLREAFQVVAAADRALSGVAKAGRQLLEEIAGAPDEGDADAERESAGESGSAGEGAGDPGGVTRKREPRSVGRDARDARQEARDDERRRPDSGTRGA